MNSHHEVVRLYEDARAKLAVGARIKGFLGIFALRNVRKMLGGVQAAYGDLKDDLKKR